MAAFLALHLTKESTGYFEVCLLVPCRMPSSISITLQGLWAWLADHDLDGDGTTQLSLFSGRGILSESQGPVWMIGTASEHHVMYQYSLVGARDHYMGLIQTETVGITLLFTRGSHIICVALLSACPTTPVTV
jgi:glucan 1,3-beta-glucosidase